MPKSYTAPALKHSLGHVAETLYELRQNSLYRSLRYGRVDGPHIVVDGRAMINLGSNDYLGVRGPVPGGPRVSSSRLISGNDDSYQTLEDMLAAHLSAESALVYPTGYMASMGLISVLGAAGCTILSDERNHASIIDGCRLARGRTRVFGHNDVDELDSMLASVDGDAVVVTEGIFSMDGDYSDIRGITEAASRHGAAVVVDDAHGDFVVGPGGRGTAELFGVSSEIYATISSLSKGLGSFGGYVAADHMVTSLQVNRSRPFIYTSALPPVIIRDAAARASLDLEGRRMQLNRNVRRMAGGLADMGLESASRTHIIPVTIGGEREAAEFSGILAENGVYAPAIRYPTVPRDRARIRISVTAALEDADIDTALAAFEEGRRRVLS